VFYHKRQILLINGRLYDKNVTQNPKLGYKKPVLWDKRQGFTDKWQKSAFDLFKGSGFRILPEIIPLNSMAVCIKASFQSFIP
jgi:hypothetical protein